MVLDCQIRHTQRFEHTLTAVNMVYPGRVVLYHKCASRGSACPDSHLGKVAAVAAAHFCYNFNNACQRKLPFANMWIVQKPQQCLQQERRSPEPVSSYVRIGVTFITKSRTSTSGQNFQVRLEQVSAFTQCCDDQDWQLLKNQVQQQRVPPSGTPATAELINAISKSPY